MNTSPLAPCSLQSRLLSVEWITMLSHELKSPMANIQSSLEIVCSQNSGHLTPTQQKFLDIAQRNVLRLQNLTRQIIDLSALQTGNLRLKLESVSVLPMLHMIEQKLHHKNENAGIHMTVECPASGVNVLADEKYLTSILSSLCDNAYRFTPTGETYTVRCLPASGSRWRWYFEVSDPGAGIPEEEREQVFIEFYKGKNPPLRGEKGSGLSLTLARGILEMLRSRLGFHRPSSGGAAFRFGLPSPTRENATIGIIHYFWEKTERSGTPLSILSMQYPAGTNGTSPKQKLACLQNIMINRMQGLFFQPDEYILAIPEKGEVFAVLPGMGEKTTELLLEHIVSDVCKDPRIPVREIAAGWTVKDTALGNAEELVQRNRMVRRQLSEIIPKPE